MYDHWMVPNYVPGMYHWISKSYSNFIFLLITMNLYVSDCFWPYRFVIARCLQDHR